SAFPLPVPPPRSINKAINTQEVAVKEKHARNILLKKGAQTFWSVVNRLPLSGNAVLCWKFCHVFHKLLRDGHSNVLKDSVRYKNELSDMSRMWGHLSEGYGQLCSIYLKLLRTKMEFHTKNPRFPGNLQMSDRQLDEAGENDVNNFFQLTVEMFDYLECELNLFQTVFNSLDMSRSVSVTAAGQCRLAPLIQVILDCSHLYDYTVKLLFKLHSCLPADTLQGHRDRFLEQFRKLKDLFYRSSNLQYFKRLIQIPQLPENPPNFLRASALSEHISPVVVIPAEASSPDSEPITDLVEMDTASQSLFDNKFDDIFGSSFSNDPFNFNSQNGMNKDDKQTAARSCRHMPSLLSPQSERRALQLRGRISELEAELAEQRHLKQQALDESEFLRAELEELKKQREDTEKAQRSLTEIERKAQANEQRYTKLKEKYSELVQNHADLLRKNAEVTKQVTVARQAQGDVEREKKELEDSFQRVSEQAQRKSQEQTEVLETLKRELTASKQELQALQGTLESSTQVRALPLGPLGHTGAAATPCWACHPPVASLPPHVPSLLPADMSSLLPCVALFAHLISDTILQGSATSHMAPMEPADRECCGAGEGRVLGALAPRMASSASPVVWPGLLEACKQCGSEAIGYLSALKEPGTLEGADCTPVRNCLSRISAIGEVGAWSQASCCMGLHPWVGTGGLGGLPNGMGWGKEDQDIGDGLSHVPCPLGLVGTSGRGCAGALPPSDAPLCPGPRRCDPKGWMSSRRSWAIWWTRRWQLLRQP
uniref:Huntingtin interacting protein 1 n=1 Tax=Apteryx owenii TaxID=8824 RepID=A0A8B9SB64_APTOW